MHEIVPAGERDAFIVRSGTTEQSWVDLSDPLRLEFEYVQRIAEALTATVLRRPPAERIRVVHVGGGGLTLPRYVAVRRPHCAQIVLEPDADLVEKVRARLPLPPGSGIKIRLTDGLTGIAAMPDDYADAVILDAFANAQVPGELVTGEFFGEVARVLRPSGVFLANVTDRSPHTWGRRVLAGMVAHWREAAVSAELPVWKGRRFGNFVAVASSSALPVSAMERDVARAAYPHRLVWGTTLTRWIGAAAPFGAADAEPSPPPGQLWFG